MKYIDYWINDFDSLIQRYNYAKYKDQQKEEERKNILLRKYAPTIKNNIAGIYAIKVEDKIVYVGKSKWIAERVDQHIGCIESVISNIIFDNDFEKKYIPLVNAVLKGYKIEFITLCECAVFTNNKYSMNITELKEKLSEEEKYYIKFYNPPLNVQYTGKKKYTVGDINEIIKNNIDTTTEINSHLTNTKNMI